MSTADETNPAQRLFTMSYVLTETATGHVPDPPLNQDFSGRILTFPQRTHDLAFDDTVLDSVKAAWEKILGERSAEYDFLRFEGMVTIDLPEVEYDVTLDTTLPRWFF